MKSRDFGSTLFLAQLMPPPWLTREIQEDTEDPILRPAGNNLPIIECPFFLFHSR